MSALTDKILAEHTPTGGTETGIRCVCGVERPGAFGWTTHIAEVTEAAVRADLASLTMDEAEASSVQVQLDRLTTRLAIESARLDALENAPSVATEPSALTPEPEGMPETGEANSAARTTTSWGAPLPGQVEAGPDWWIVGKIGGDGIGLPDGIEGYSEGDDDCAESIHSRFGCTRPDGHEMPHRAMGADLLAEWDIPGPAAPKPDAFEALHEALAEEPWGTKEDYTCSGCGCAIPCRHCPDNTPTVAQKNAAPKLGDMLTVKQLEGLPVGAWCKSLSGKRIEKVSNPDRIPDGDWQWTGWDTAVHSSRSLARYAGPITLVSLPEPAVPTWRPLQRISREEALSSVDGIVVRCIEDDPTGTFEGGCIAQKRGEKWHYVSAKGHNGHLCYTNGFDLLWHPDFAEQVSE